MAVLHAGGEDVDADPQDIRLGEAAGSLGIEKRRERIDAPLGIELVVWPRRPERARSPASQGVDGFLELGPVLRQLVDARGGRRRKLALAHDSSFLEIAK